MKKDIRVKISHANYWPFIIPALLILTLLTIVPIVILIITSFSSWNLLYPTDIMFDLENYQNILRDSRFWNSIKISFTYIFVPTFFQLVLGFILASLLKKNLPGTRFCRTLFIIPMIIPPVVVGLIWKILFTPGLGGINYFLSLIGISGPDWLGTPGWALVSVIIASVWAWTPYTYLMFLAGLESLPSSMFEAAAIDGANGFQVTRFITVPSLKPVLSVVIMFRVIEALANFPIVDVMTKGGPASATEAINYYAFDAGFVQMRIGYASSLLVIFLFICMIFSVIFVRDLLKGRDVDYD